MGRVFIKTGDCSGYQYLGTADLAGISTSFGESTYIYKPSETSVNEYDIVAEIIPQNSNTWSSSLTMYLDLESSSLLLSLAKLRCSFALQVHYGSCVNPTEFADFRSGFLLEGVTISDYSTGQLTARSPDARGIIEDSVTITATNVKQIISKAFTQSQPYSVLPMGLFSIAAAPNIPCDAANYRSSGVCGNDCNYVGLGVSSSSGIYSVTRIDGAWYSNRLAVAGLTDTSDPGVVVYTGTKAVFLLDYLGAGIGASSSMQVYTLNNTDLKNTTITSVDADGRFAGNSLTFSRQVYLNSNKLFIAATDHFSGTQAVGIVYNIATNIVTYLTLPNAANKELLGVVGNGSNIFYYGKGYLVAYNATTGAMSDLSSNLPVSNKNITFINPVSQKRLYINIETSSGVFKTYCTSNGGNTWVLVGSAPEYFTRYKWQKSEIGYAFGASNTVFETFDGGVTWKENSTLFTFTITDLDICDDNIVICESNSSRTDSLIGQI